MGKRKAERRRRGRALWLVAAPVALVLTLFAVGGVLGLGPAGDQTTPGTAPAPSSSPAMPQASVSADLSNLPIERDLDCHLLDDGAVQTALGAQVSDRDHYSNGDLVEVTPGLTDVVHEDSCGYRSSVSEARVWVFVPPVGTTDARKLVREARDEKGCTYPDDATGYGTPGLTGVCRNPQTERVTVTMRGLFGDAWLSCRLDLGGGLHPDEAQQRANSWCTHVATTLGARP